MKGAAVAAFISFLIVAQPAVAQALTPPEAQATLDAERAQVEVARAQATSVSRLATANAPTATPAATITPQPSATVAQSNTPAPTATSAPTATIAPTVAPTVAPTPAPSATSTPSPSELSIAGRLPVEAWCIAGFLLVCAGIGIGLQMLSGIKGAIWHK